MKHIDASCCNTAQQDETEPHPKQLHRTRQAALRLLSRREHSRQELIQKLRKMGHEHAQIVEALAYCQQHDFQCDTRFATQFCRVKIERGEGPIKIIWALKQHGYDEAEIQRLFVLEHVDWVKVACQVLEKQQWRFQSPDALAKQTRFLTARGFPVEVIRLSIEERSRYEDR